MSADRGGRPITHGVRQQARLLGVTKAPARRTSRAEVRIDSRTRRRLNRLERQLDANPAEEVRLGLIGSISRARLLEQRADVELLATADLSTQLGLGKFAYWISNRRQRDEEQLLELERRRAADVPTLDEYLRAKAATNGNATAQPLPSAASAAEVETSAVVADAAAPAACSEEQP